MAKHVCSWPGCDRAFAKESRLREHGYSHTGERPFACTLPDCGKAFTRKAHLLVHEKSHTGVKDFRCEEEGCDKAFTSSSHLRRHAKVHQQSRPFKCDFPECPAEFGKHKQLKRHEYEHTGLPPYKCEQPGCYMRFVCPSRLESHLKTHSKSYKCPHGCDVSFGKWSELVAHNTAHHANFVCETCGRAFQLQEYLDRHLPSHLQVQERFPCPEPGCGKEYSSAYNLSAHRRSVHEMRKFACNVPACGRTFAHKCSLKKHMSCHEQQQEASASVVSELTGIVGLPLEVASVLSPPSQGAQTDPLHALEAAHHHGVGGGMGDPASDLAPPHLIALDSEPPLGAWPTHTDGVTIAEALERSALAFPQDLSWPAVCTA